MGERETAEKQHDGTHAAREALHLALLLCISDCGRREIDNVKRRRLATASTYLGTFPIIAAAGDDGARSPTALRLRFSTPARGSRGRRAQDRLLVRASQLRDPISSGSYH
jgi:hypothetical protein